MKVSPIALAFTVLASRNAHPIRAFSNAAKNALLHQSSSTATHSAASSPSHAASIVASRVNMSSAVEAASVTSSVASSNPLLECTDLPKFTAIEPSQLTPAIGSILEKLEADFAALEAKLVEGVNEKVIMRYDDVLPVVERMQHPLGEFSFAATRGWAHPPPPPPYRFIDISLVSTSRGKTRWFHPPSAFYVYYIFCDVDRVYN